MTTNEKDEEENNALDKRKINKFQSDETHLNN